MMPNYGCVLGKHGDRKRLLPTNLRKQTLTKLAIKNKRITSSVLLQTNTPIQYQYLMMKNKRLLIRLQLYTNIS